MDCRCRPWSRRFRSNARSGAWDWAAPAPYSFCQGWSRPRGWTSAIASAPGRAPADDLTALDAGGRLDFVARHDRSGEGRDHLGVDSEVGEFFLDQTTGELQRLDRHGFLHRRRLVEQRQWRQHAVSAEVLEQAGLLLFFDALRLDHGDHLRLDLDGRRGHMFFNVLGALDDDDFVALDGGHLALAAVLAVLVALDEPFDDHLDAAADALGHGQPRDVEEQTKTEAEQQQQEQRRAGEAQRHMGRVADQLTEHAARLARQLRAQAPHAQVFQRHAADEHQQEADGADQALLLVLRLDVPGHDEFLRQPAIAVPDDAQQADAQPPRGKTEDKQQQIG